MHRMLVSLLPLLVAAPLMGQTMLGLRAGLSRSTLDSEAFQTPPDEIIGFDLDLEEGARLGMVAGVDVAFPVAGALEFRIGAAYSQKGQRQSAEFGIEGESLATEATLELDYFQLASLARVGTSRDGGWSVGVLLGPWASLRVSCNINASYDVEEFSGMVSSPCDEFGTANAVKSTDFGIAAGASAELAVSEKLRLALDVLYSVGLADINDADDSMDDPMYDTSVRTGNLAIQAGVVIPLGS